MTQKPSTDGRVERLIRWLRENHDRVERVDNVQLTFNCAGRSESVEIKEREQISTSSK